MRMTPDEQRSADYDQIAHVICRKLAALMNAGWAPPFTVDATDADDEPMFDLEYDGNRYATADDMRRLLPDLKFPVTVSISDRGGRFLLVEIKEDLMVNRRHDLENT